MNCTAGALALAIATVLTVPALEAKPEGPKHTAAHDAAVQRCTEVYEAAAARPMLPISPTGKARMRATHAAAEAKKGCVAQAAK